MNASTRHANMEPRFIADNMLGKLSKWLRIIGYDTIYFRDIEDSELVKLAVKENRIILTRDTLLIKRRLAKNISFLVKSDHWREQIKEVTGKFAPNLKSNALTRCIICNHILTPVEKETTKDNVPPYVYETQNFFVQCKKCEKIFWAGTHIMQINDFLKALVKKPNINS